MSGHFRGSVSARITVPLVITALLLGAVSPLVILTVMVTDTSVLGGTLLVLAAWALVPSFVFGMLGVWIARRISEPLAEISEGARRVAEGDYSAEIDVPGDTEIGGLAEGFNQMTAALRERNESLTKKVLDLSALHESSRIVGSTLELETLLESALDSALRVCGVETGYVAMYEDDRSTLEIRARRGSVPEEVSESQIEASMARWVVRESRPLIFNPSRDDDGVPVDPVTGSVSALSVPLISADGPIGAVTVGTGDAGFRFVSDDVRLLATIANHVTTAIGTVELFESLHESYLSTVRSLAAAVDAKDPFTRGHSDRVAMYAALAAEEMGLTQEQCMALEMAAYLHDIGKIGIPENILLKPGRLSDEEMSRMRNHPLIGASILEPVSFPWPITPVVRHHHERWDGTGYPSSLEATRIPLLARILSVADAYEAMISDRPYRAGRTSEEALAELVAGAGMQFDSDVVDAFASALPGRSDEAVAVVGSEAERSPSADPAPRIG